MFPGYFPTVVLLSVAPLFQQVDYKLQVQSFGYEDIVNKGKTRPKERVLRQIVIRVKRGVPFHNEVTIGDRELVLSGKVRLGENGKLNVRIRYEDNRLTEYFVPDNDGRWHRIKDMTSAKTTLELPLGKETAFGGFEGGDGTKSSKCTFRAKLLPFPQRSQVRRRGRSGGPRPIHTDAAAASGIPGMK